MLEIVDRREREFTARDETILTQLAQLASVAISNAQLYERERTIAQTLQRSLRPGALPDRAGPVGRGALPARRRGRRAGRRLLRPLRGRRRRLRGADRRRPGQGPGRGRGDRARPPHAARRRGLRGRARAASSRCCTRRCASSAATAASAPSPTPTCALGDGRMRVDLACGGHPLPLVVHPDGARRAGRPSRHAARHRHRAAPLRRHRRARRGRRARALHRRRDRGPAPPPRGVRPRRADRAAARRCGGLPPDAVADRVEAAVLAASEGRLRDDMAILALGPTPADGRHMLPRAPATEEIDG